MTITGARDPPPATRPQRVSRSAVQRGLLGTSSAAKKRKGRHLGERHVIAGVVVPGMPEAGGSRVVAIPDGRCEFDDRYIYCRGGEVVFPSPPSATPAKRWKISARRRPAPRDGRSVSG